MAEKERRRLHSPKEVEVHEKNTKVRWILALVFFVIGVVALAVGVSSCVEGDPGWQDITVASAEMNCSSDFNFRYNFLEEDQDIKTANREVTNLYAKATERAYKLFYTTAPSGNGGLRDINDSPNQAVTVDSRLYQALEQIQLSGDRQLYLAPAFVEYRRVFQSEDVSTAQDRDPGQNPELMPYISKISDFAKDPAMIDLQLLGNNQVKLWVSPQYLAFAEEYEIDTYLDFGWMCNAFIIDYIAQDMIDGGYTRGFLSSFDGFTRNLDGSGEVYGINVFDRLENGILIPAKLEYTGPASLVYLRNYPLSQQDQWLFYVFADGKTVSTMLDPADGVCKSATDNILAVSTDSGCADMVLKLSPLFIADALDEEGLTALTDMHCIWFEGTTLKHTGSPEITLMPQEDTPVYKLQKVN